MSGTPNNFVFLVSFSGERRWGSICTELWAFKKGFSTPGLSNQRRIISNDFRIHRCGRTFLAG